MPGHAPAPVPAPAVVAALIAIGRSAARPHLAQTAAPPSSTEARGLCDKALTAAPPSGTEAKGPCNKAPPPAPPNTTEAMGTTDNALPQADYGGGGPGADQQRPSGSPSKAELFRGLVVSPLSVVAATI